MKKLSLLIVLFVLSISLNSFAQSIDFYAGKWSISVIGTPNGDAKFSTELIRKEGKLTGELKDETGQLKEAIPITNIEETDGKLIIYFSAQGYDVNIEFSKVDDENLKGMLLNMFESKAVRIK